MPSPSVNFSPQEGCPGCGQALEGRSGPIVLEVAPYLILEICKNLKFKRGCERASPLVAKQMDTQILGVSGG